MSPKSDRRFLWLVPLSTRSSDLNSVKDKKKLVLFLLNTLLVSAAQVAAESIASIPGVPPPAIAEVKAPDGSVAVVTPDAGGCMK